ncbi:hypothetical protein DdX_02171 [Ditylenchus destructor]|uniref:Uncharacterized protein n=1 Tax=Ditylenchus destructor TaxID=166010 RepID=A0AAD4NH57_9BILA|nr:hypothetical protein DdX_02171 [Ditylenchus destructor]
MDEYKYECKPKALSDEHSRLSHSEKPRQRNIQSKHLSCGFLLLQLLVGLLVLGSAMLIVIFQHPKALLDVQPNFETAEESVLRASCARTCKFEIAESIPQNLTFNGP